MRRYALLVTICGVRRFNNCRRRIRSSHSLYKYIYTLRKPAGTKFASNLGRFYTYKYIYTNTLLIVPSLYSVVHLGRGRVTRTRRPGIVIDTCTGVVWLAILLVTYKPDADATLNDIDEVESTKIEKYADSVCVWYIYDKRARACVETIVLFRIENRKYASVPDVYKHIDAFIERRVEP